MMQKRMTAKEYNPEPRWPAILAVVAVAGLFLVLPESMTLGPSWAFPILVLPLLLTTILSRRMNRLRLNVIAGHLMLGLITAAMVTSLGLLLYALPSHKETPKDLLISASALWLVNILVFASWYWRLDAGGPNQRDLRGSHTDGAFLFPQMTMDADLKAAAGEENWRPGFVDYLFLAFNTSTAFSPTDVPVLSRWAKVMMMTQSLISLTTIAFLAARAVNIL
jgi:hypothetical protein